MVSKLHQGLNILGRGRQCGYSEADGCIDNQTGIDEKRDINNCNPQLAALLTRELGSDAWVTDLDQLQGLVGRANDPQLMSELMDIKRANKERFAG